MTAGLLAAPAIGFLLGFRHAFEPDHLAAVTTLASRQGSTRDAVRLGLAWAAGHTAAVGALALVMLAFGVRLPDGFHAAAERLAAALLIVLGSSVLLRAWHGTRHQHAPVRDARRSLAFGVVHGVAGSGAVAALLVVTASGRPSQLACFATFGAGTAFGMLAVSTAVAAAARQAEGRRWAAGLHVLAGCASVLAGLWLAARV